MANTNSNGLMVGDQEIVASKEPANNRYGQNGYQGASSDLPGQHTTSGFLLEVTIEESDWQTRQVDAKQLSPSYGMKDRNAAPTIIQGHISHTRNVLKT